MSRKLLSCLLIIMLLFSVSCTTQGGGDGNYQVTASFYPVYVFALNLLDGVEGVTLSNMTESQGGCLHDYQLSAKDMKLLSRSDMLIINGAGMEQFLDKAMGEAKNLNIVDTSAGITLIEADGHDHDHEEGDGHDHDHSVLSHIWLSVPNALRQIDAICNALVIALPAQADTLRANRDAYVARLVALDTELRTDAARLTSPVVTFHSAYEYFSKEYSVPVLMSLETEEGEEPSAKDLAALKALMLQNNVRSLFVEPEYKGSAANVLAGETGARVYVLDPITSQKTEDDKTAYEVRMRENMRTLLASQGE